MNETSHERDDASYAWYALGSLFLLSAPTAAVFMGLGANALTLLLAGTLVVVGARLQEIRTLTLSAGKLEVEFERLQAAVNKAYATVQQLQEVGAISIATTLDQQPRDDTGEILPLEDDVALRARLIQQAQDLGVSDSTTVTSAIARSKDRIAQRIMRRLRTAFNVDEVAAMNPDHKVELGEAPGYIGNLRSTGRAREWLREDLGVTVVPESLEEALLDVDWWNEHGELRRPVG